MRATLRRLIPQGVLAEEIGPNTLSSLSKARVIPQAEISRLSRRNRARIEATIERLIAMLDEIDGDPDLEPAFGLALRPGEVDEAEDENEHGTEIDRGEGDEAQQIDLWHRFYARGA